MEDFGRKYRAQMNTITLSEEADKAILNDLLNADANRRVPYMKRAKRSFSAAMVAATVAIASSATVFAGVAIHGMIVKSNKEESQIAGVGATANVGDSYYYDFLAGKSGEVYALTDNDYYGELTDAHAVAWVTRDGGSTWEEVLDQPAGLTDESHLFAGDLYEGQEGIEATIIMEVWDDAKNDTYTNRVYRVTADEYTEYDMDDVYAEIGDQDHLFNVKYVNDHVIALVATTECMFYDTDTQEIVKTIPYDLTMGCLATPEQFFIYGQEINTCLDAATLEEQEPAEGLNEFVQTMYEKNQRQVMPPMAVQDDTIICVNSSGIFEYQKGTTTQIREMADEVRNGHPFNGLLPLCKANDGTYYVCTFGEDANMNLWQLDRSSAEMK